MASAELECLCLWLSWVQRSALRCIPQRSRNRGKEHAGPLIRRFVTVSSPVAASHLAHCAVTSFEDSSSHMASGIAQSQPCVRPGPRTVLHSSGLAPVSPRPVSRNCATAIIDSVSNNGRWGSKQQCDDQRLSRSLPLRRRHLGTTLPKPISISEPCCTGRRSRYTYSWERPTDVCVL